MKQAPVVLCDYDPRWPEKFEREKTLLLAVLGDYLCGSVEHVGSTAVPGLKAKPIIDIMFGVESLERSKSAIELLAAVHYEYAPYKTDVMHWFCKPSEAHRTHHLHLIPYESTLWKERIGFRDSLRRDRQIAEEYACLKTALAERYKDDREAYTEAKWPFIQQILNTK